MCSCSVGYGLNYTNNQSCNGMFEIFIIICFHINNIFSSDINECLSNKGNCSQICTNTNGSYFCSCTSGYTLIGDRMTCNGMFKVNSNILSAECMCLKPDTNECTIANGNCSQICTNTIGSYQCYCSSGYFLEVDNRTCNGK